VFCLPSGSLSLSISRVRRSMVQAGRRLRIASQPRQRGKAVRESDPARQGKGPEGLKFAGAPDGGAADQQQAAGDPGVQRLAIERRCRQGL
jgi:hypothetical protein